jgi:hypothetical protein
MIALADPAAVDPAAGHQDAAVIGRMQDSVLSVVDTTEFRLRVRYTAVPALAGTVMSAAALRALASHRYVKRIDLDLGGTGTR